MAAATVLSRKTITFILLCMTLLGFITENKVLADVYIGTCLRGTFGYVPDCHEECQRRNYKSGHCGVFLLFIVGVGENNY